MHERKIYARGHKKENRYVDWRAQNELKQTGGQPENETWIETDHGFLLNNYIGILFAIKSCCTFVSMNNAHKTLHLSNASFVEYDYADTPELN